MKLPLIDFSYFPPETMMTCIYSSREEMYTVGEEYTVIKDCTNFKYYSTIIRINTNIVNQYDLSIQDIFWSENELKYGSFGVFLYPTDMLTHKQRFYFKFGGQFDGWIKNV